MIITIMIMLLFIQITTILSLPWDESSYSRVEKRYGHYPPVHLTVTNVVLQGDTFTYTSEHDINITEYGSMRIDTWKFERRRNNADIECHSTFNVAFIYLYYYFYG